LGDWLGVLDGLFRFLIQFPIWVVVAVIAGSCFLASRFSWGRRIGVPRLCAIGYLLLLIFLFWFAAAPNTGEDSMGYQWLPLLGATFPWGLLCEAMLANTFQGNGIASLVLSFVVFVVICGGLNCAIFVLLCRAVKATRHRVQG
jgi:hypothetical protein